jgi:hypothetical protein
MAVLDAFSAAIGMGSGPGGFGSASSLDFAAMAPLVLPPSALPELAAPEVAPEVIALAAAQGSNGPVPAGLPALTVGAAALAVAAAVAAHLAAAARRRDIFA